MRNSSTLDEEAASLELRDGALYKSNRAQKTKTSREIFIPSSSRSGARTAKSWPKKRPALASRRISAHLSRARAK